MKSISGATVSTFGGCYLACEVEKNTNRLFYRVAPHWYAHVDHASGLSEEQLLIAHEMYADLPTGASLSFGNSWFSQEKFISFD